MNTRENILAILSRSEKPSGPKIIASELKKSNVNIRKILSNLYKEGKITRVGYGKYAVLSVNETVNETVNVEAPETKKLIYKEIYKYQKAYFKRLKISDPEAYEKIKKARNRYLKKWRADNPDYNKNWLSAYYKKHKEKFREYQKRYWLKKALSQE